MNNKIELANQLMLETGEDIDSYPLPESSQHIKEVEEALKVILPKSYKYFLDKYGNLSFDGETFYGLTKSGKAATAAPSVIFVTNTLRQRGDLSDSMIAIKTSGYGPNFCIDLSEVDEHGEGPVYEVPLSFKRTGDKTKLSENFADFFYDEIKAAVDDLEGEG
ncbi:SMI1/KNR4 family protein [Microbulbifer sp. ZKSA004]|uniref:SMI1/KNR4 family protein n=1 Tax=Microbulbifer sp. ZKSA004 TaxID=3243389 RepID=UPI004039B9EA